MRREGRQFPGSRVAGSSVRPCTLLLHNSARILGGAKRYQVQLLARLQERGHRVVFLSRDEGIAERARSVGVPAEVAHLGGHLSLHHAARFATQLRRHRPDGLLLGTFKKSWLGWLGAHLAGVPRVVARIGLDTDLPGRSAFYRFAFRRWIDRVVVNAHELVGPVLASLAELDPERVLVIHNGVQAPEPARPPGVLRREFGIPPDAPVVGAVARLVPQKRLDLLLRARWHASTACAVCWPAGDRTRGSSSASPMSSDWQGASRSSGTGRVWATCWGRSICS